LIDETGQALGMPAVLGDDADPTRQPRSDVVGAHRRAEVGVVTVDGQPDRRQHAVETGGETQRVLVVLLVHGGQE
jgi:hypothetical protein